MPNRVFTDFNKLRQETNDLIDRGQVRVHIHARKSHPELSEFEQVATVRFGGTPRPDRNRGPSKGVYLCWARLPRHGLCRGVFCIEEIGGGSIVLVTTAFRES